MKKQKIKQDKWSYVDSFFDVLCIGIISVMGGYGFFHFLSIKLEFYVCYLLSGFYIVIVTIILSNLVADVNKVRDGKLK